MPCRDYEDDWGTRNQSQHEKIDKLAAMLCACCELIESKNINVPQKAYEWWERHQENDRLAAIEQTERKKQRALVNSALVKLSPEEKEALQNIGLEIDL